MAQTRDTDAASRQRRSRSSLTEDDLRLHELGYPRQLARRVNAFGNLAMSATIINFITGIMYSTALVMASGGPRVMVWGWVLVGLMVLFVGASMAEINSALPTSGALYYWSAKLAKRHNAAWSWYTGWLNFAGQIAGTASADFGAATFIQALAAAQWSSYRPTTKGTLAIYAAVLAVHGLLNTFTVRLVAFLNKVAVWWLLIGTMVIVGWLAVFPSHHTSASFAFTHFVNSTGFHSGIYAGLIGLLFSAGTFTGFDASAHMSEETVHASVSAPKGMVRSIAFSWIVGLILIIAMTFSMTDYSNQAGAPVPPLVIFTGALGLTTAKLFMLVVIGSMLFCGLANLTSNSRQIFAFSRDGAMPGSKWWRTVRNGTPVNAVWFAAVGAFVLAVPSLWSTTAFPAIVSINVIGLFGSYGIAIWLWLRRRGDFERGPWNLGRFSVPVARVAITWVVFSSILFLLPQVSPITAKTFNYAPVALGVVLVVAGLWWVITARRSFQGPISYGTPEELAQIEAEL
ncbi:amino acid permease [Catenulispora pinisilvae]|uniref:amino acid permease n=1 Tax=Catenulispora pinisilvae TaxID=2705253 RepID=UPI0018923ADC|nr:amino acid permease [Catenulispora pinisilvae]